MRQCTKCGEVKPLSSFYYRKNRKTYESSCRACAVVATAKWVQKNRTRSREYFKKYSALKPEKRWHQTHPEKSKAAMRRRYSENKAKHALEAWRYRRTFPGLLTGMLASMRKNSKDRGHAAPEIQNRQQLRAWLLRQPNFRSLWKAYRGFKFDPLLKPSIDRLDNSKGYQLDNIRLVTWRENALAFVTSEEHKDRCRKRFQKMWSEIRALQQKQ